MKAKFIVIGLSEKRIVTSTRLSSNGIEEESEYFVIGKNDGDYDTYDEAMIMAEKVRPSYELGVEIKIIYT